MSIKIRNPFLLRASETIESDTGFLRLYSPLVLDYFIEMQAAGKLWNILLFIRSSPGAGKSSLLRLFQPNALLTLQNRKSGEEFKEVFKKLKKIEVVSEESIHILGVNLTFTRNYELIENFSGIEAGNRDRLFYSLLNSRIITATLRSILILKRLNFPEDLHRISFTYPNTGLYYQKIDVPCNGQALYEWAAGIERSIYERLDSFLPMNQIPIEGHNELFSIETLKPEYLKVDGKPVVNRILFMLDDVHKLSGRQRGILISHLLEKRNNVSLWLSERLEALDNLRTNQGRDYEELNLEDYWKDREAKFERLLINIAYKRAAESRDGVEFGLESQQDEFFFNDIYAAAKAELFSAINVLTDSNPKFDIWKDYLFNNEGTDQNICQLAKQMEILIHRNLAKRELDLGFQLSLDELHNKTDEKVIAAAKLFLSKQFSLPYYFGMGTLARISTNNVEQFLSFGSRLYERMLSMNLNMTIVSLSAKEQDKEIRRISNDKWRELQKFIPESSLVIRFLQNLCTFCSADTFRNTAPYAPGVTGFHIDAARTIKLINEEDWLSNELFSDLQVVLNTCLAFNLLHTKEVMQGKKGERKNVYYLNRWLCVKFDLPLSYGGWRTKKPDELLRWVRK